VRLVASPFGAVRGAVGVGPRSSELRLSSGGPAIGISAIESAAFRSKSFYVKLNIWLIMKRITRLLREFMITLTRLLGLRAAVRFSASLANVSFALTKQEVFVCACPCQ